MKNPGVSRDATPRGLFIKNMSFIKTYNLLTMSDLNFALLRPPLLRH